MLCNLICFKTLILILSPKVGKTQKLPVLVIFMLIFVAEMDFSLESVQIFVWVQ